MIIADITRAYQKTEGQFVRLFHQRLSFTGSRGAVVMYDRQRRALIIPPEVGTIVVNDLASAYEIAAAIREQAILPTLRNSPQEPIEIFSFHRPVIELSATLPDGHRAQTLHWSHLREGGVLQDPPAEKRSMAINHVPVPEKANTAVLEILSQHPLGLGITALREFLVARHPDLAKSAGGPPVKSILMPMRERGLISVEPPEDVNPWIRLVASSANLNTTQPETMAPPAAPADAPKAEMHLPATEPEVRDGVAVGKEIEKEKKKRRLKQLHDHLAKNHFGPFSDDRSSFFNEIERLVAEKRHSAMKLLRKAARKVVEDRKLPFPWSGVEEFLFNLFDRRRVLLDCEGTARSPKDLASAAFPITHTIENWRDLLEMEMVLRLAEVDGRIHRRELDRLAFLFFPQLDDEAAYDRLDHLLAIAASENRARFVDDTLVVSPSSSNAVAAIKVLPPTDTEAMHASPAA